MSVIPNSLKIFWLGYLIASIAPLFFLYVKSKK